jgi:hypothetical protein
MAGEWQHLHQDHHADPDTVARDAPDQETASLIHDAAHEYPDAPWPELVVRGQAEAWWRARNWERGRDPRDDPAEWRDFFREVRGCDMPLNALHEARISQFGDVLTPDMWTNGPDGTSTLHGFDAAALARERGETSFPHLYQQRYLQLSAAGQPLRGALDGLAARSFPYGPAAGLRPDNGAGTSSGQSAHGPGRRHPDQGPPTTRGRGPR